MSDRRISDLPSINNPGGEDIFYVVDTSSSASKKITYNDLILTKFTSLSSDVVLNTGLYNTALSAIEVNKSLIETLFTFTGFNSQVFVLSSRFDAAFTSLTANSANYDSAYTTLCANSANYDSAYTTLRATSANYDSAYTTLCATSANYDSAYTTLCATSALYNSHYTSFRNISSKYESTYTTVNTTSANLKTIIDFTTGGVYNIIEEYNGDILHFDTSQGDILAVIDNVPNGFCVDILTVGNTGIFELYTNTYTLCALSPALSGNFATGKIYRIGNNVFATGDFGKTYIIE